MFHANREYDVQLHVLQQIFTRQTFELLRIHTHDSYESIFFGYLFIDSLVYFRCDSQYLCASEVHFAGAFLYMQFVTD